MTAGASPGIRARFTREFGRFRLAVDLTLPARGVTVLFGGSGSGKTTLLRCLAGLEPRARGFLSVDGEVWQDDAARRFRPAHRRSVGYVFQDAALFPHLSVRQNLAYGMQRVDAGERRVGFDQAVDLMGLRPLLDRAPLRLSGGEQQRVGMARALLTSPRLLLMDEPLAALDLPLKRDILPYLERLHDELDIPVLYVTHSTDEMTRLGDHLVLLAAGRVTGQGPLAALLGGLAHHHLFVDEPGVVIDTRVAAHDREDGITRLDFPGGALWVARRPEPVGQRLRCRIRPGDVSLTLTRAGDTSILNVLPVTIVGIDATRDPATPLIQLDLAGAPLLARVTRRSCRVLGLRPGLAVFAQIKALAFFDGVPP